ncbi:bifunctional metallophosphatase/5'-nucleotidase [Bhargavaea cecembensis]|uniref:bifunctional metallophosphatase/5'-nucleotidase n=1 Tax=Bhargavaea cecembensis TaxID=394098 RepID=UPI00058B1E41|nr:bifunctional UDP-sugar hydrolase/5'-nucleotidase [Bhargavaea cecembensis]
MIETIHIYHTNDLHSHFEKWPRIRSFLKERLAEHEAAGEPCFLFDIGDHIDRSHPYTEATLGKGNMAMLEDLGYDAVTIGNNEGITLAPDDLDGLYRGVPFPVVLGNLTRPDGSLPDWASEEAILTTPSGIRIGLIGATADFTSSYESLGWRIGKPGAWLAAAAPGVKAHCDLVICLSHMGSTADDRLAEEAEGSVDVILGAHTHHVYAEGRRIGETLIGAAGKWGQYVGEITLSFDTVKGTLVDSSATVHDSETLPAPGDDLSFDAGLRKEAERLMADPVFFNPAAMPESWTGPSPLSKFFSDALRIHTDADCAMYNSGIFLGGLRAGGVSRMDLHRLMPHPINPCVIELTGEELEEAYDLSFDPEWPDIRLKGLGFRGEVMGAMIHHRLTKSEDGRLLVAGHPLDRGRTYRLATLDLFTYGFFFPSFKLLPKKYFMPEFIRDVLAEHAVRMFGAAGS